MIIQEQAVETYRLHFPRPGWPAYEIDLLFISFIENSAQIWGFTPQSILVS